MIKIITKENLVLFSPPEHKDPVFVSHLARTSRSSPQISHGNPVLCPIPFCARSSLWKLS